MFKSGRWRIEKNKVKVVFKLQFHAAQVSIQRIEETIDQREIEGENAEVITKGQSLRSHLRHDDEDETIERNIIEDVPFSKSVSPLVELNGNLGARGGSDLTMSSSESSSRLGTPLEPQVTNEDVDQEPVALIPSPKPHEPKSDTPTSIHEENFKSQWEWLGNPGLESSTDDSSSTPREFFLSHPSEDASCIVIEKLKTDIAALSRQAEVSELELQTLRKQIVKESKRGQDLFREVVCLKEERDGLKVECDKLKAMQWRTAEAKTKTSLRFEGGDAQAIIEELRQELNHAKELNANFQVQLQKTQEANAELILAVRDLDEMLEQKNGEMLNNSNGLSAEDDDVGSREAGGFKHQADEVNDDEEQKALEELVKEHSHANETYLLEQQIVDMRGEIETYKRERDVLEMQMEQLELDYEILKQENHDSLHKLEQSQLEEQLRLQYEGSSSQTARELETRIEKLESELKRQSKESADSLVTVSELEAHISCLEDELEKQAQGFEAGLEALTRSRIEQEQRAIRAEETLRKIRLKNANMAEQLQEEFRRVSVQMTSTFEANEKLAAKALAEANELRFQKHHFEEMVQKSSEEYQSLKDHYESRLHQFAGQMTSMTHQIEELHSEIESRTLQQEHQKKNAEETQKLQSDEILMLKNEIDTCVAKNKLLLEEIGDKETLVCELEQMKISIKEMELLVEQGTRERNELEIRLVLVKKRAEESYTEFNRYRCLVEEKETIVRNLQSELDSLQAQHTQLQHSLLEDELEKDKLRKHIIEVETNLKKSEDAMKEVAYLMDKVKLLEDQIKLKETALETSSNTFVEKEKDLHDNIEELEDRLKLLKDCSMHDTDNEVEKIVLTVEDQPPNCSFSEESVNNSEQLCSTAMISNTNNCASLSTNSNSLPKSQKDPTTDSGGLDEFIYEMALLRERNTSMEEELKEMQQRYSEISLKFAEVEGQRQQLEMKVRYLKSTKKRS